MIGAAIRTHRRSSPTATARAAAVTTNRDVALSIPKLRLVVLPDRAHLDVDRPPCTRRDTYVHGVDPARRPGVAWRSDLQERSPDLRRLDECRAFRPDADHVEFPYVFLYATYLHVRPSPRITSKRSCPPRHRRPAAKSWLTSYSERVFSCSYRLKKRPPVRL